MRRSRFAFVLASALSLLAMPILAIARLAGGFMRDAFALLAPEPATFRDDYYALAMSIGGASLAPDLQQSLRHEAGVPRVSAARHT